MHALLQLGRKGGVHPPHGLADVPREGGLPRGGDGGGGGGRGGQSLDGICVCGRVGVRTKERGKKKGRPSSWLTTTLSRGVVRCLCYYYFYLLLCLCRLRRRLGRQRLLRLPQLREQRREAGLVGGQHLHNVCVWCVWFIFWGGGRRRGGCCLWGSMYIHIHVHIIDQSFTHLRLQRGPGGAEPQQQPGVFGEQSGGGGLRGGGGGQEALLEVLFCCVGCCVVLWWDDL